MTRLLLTGGLAGEVAALIADAPDTDVRCADQPSDRDLAWADCLVGFVWPRGATQAVDWIHVTGLGVDGFAAAPTPRLLTRTVGSMPDQMARYVTAAALPFVQGHAAFAQAQRERRWLADPPHLTAKGGKDAPRRRCTALPPFSAVVLGTGLAASAVARALRSLGGSVTGVNRSGHPADAFDRVVPWSRVHDALAERPDVLIDLLPLTADTRDAVDAGVLAHLDGALFINTGRGATVVEEDLRTALAEGHVAQAWLDVHRIEPLPDDHWAWTHPDVRVTPHIAALTTAEDVACDLLAALDAQRAGRRPTTQVDPPPRGRSAEPTDPGSTA